MNGFAWFWLFFASAQLAVAGYALLATLRWRGARLWPTREAPLEAPLWLGLGLMVGLASWFLWRVGDVEFTRWVGTGSVMLVTLSVLTLLLRRVAREETAKRALAADGVRAADPAQQQG